MLLAISLLVTLPATAQQRPMEIDPNTKIEGGVVRPERKPEVTKPDPGPVARPEKAEPKDEKPISARTPQEENREREREAEAAKGETAKPQ